MEASLAAYLPQDRRAALARGEALPEHAYGAALFADIAGFTPLTEALARALGQRGGVEELTHQLNQVYTALIAAVDRANGSVIDFAGDSIMCWFNDGSWESEVGSLGIDVAANPPTPNSHPPSPARAVACALAMQDAMGEFVTIALPDGTTTILALKVAVAAGPARRFAVGDPDLRRFDVLAGAPLMQVASGEHLARPGEVLIDEATAAALGDTITIAEWRADIETGERFAIVTMMDDRRWTMDGSAHRPSIVHRLSSDRLRPWLLPAVYERHQAGLGDFLTELRPAVALFLRFTGIDFVGDLAAATTLDTLIRLVQHKVTRYGGTLLQLTIGDKGSYLYVVFGAPTAHEDDSRRAVLAALELRDVLVAQDGLDTIQIGISRGVMRVGAYGGPTRQTYGVLGDDVNLAARLMLLAAPGEVVISGRVQAALGAAVALEPRPPIRLKGKAEPLPVFAVTRARRRRAIRLEEPSYALPMVGRQHARDSIVARLDQALAGHGQIVGITAEAGMGKSRLLAEVIRVAQQRGMQGYGGFCRSDGLASPYLVWEPIWQAFFDVDPAAPLRRQTRALEGLLDDLAPERRDALPLLGPLLGLSLPENDFTRTLEPQFRQSVLHALLVDCITAAAREAQEAGIGVLLILEDLHWIDAISHDLLEQIAQAIVDLPILIVLAYRPPELLRLQAPRVEALPHFTRVALNPLSTAEAALVIRAKLAQLLPERAGTASQALIARVTEKAQGNPFYVEELLNYLHDRGIDPHDTPAITALDLPSSLHTLILSRIDQLGARQQATLKLASVIGRLFRFAHLQAAFPLLHEPAALRGDLEELARLELTPLDTPEPELAYLFKHIVTHEVAYESLASATRARLHEQYARFVEAQAGDDPARFLDLLAYHYDRSENLAKRREYLRRAGEMAQAAYANEAALDYYTRLLPLLQDGRDRIAIHLKAGTVLEVMGSWIDMEAHYREALRLAEQTGDAAARARSQLALGMMFQFRGEYAVALSWLNQARAAWAALGDRSELSQVMLEIGRVYSIQGLHAAAIEQYQESVALARDAGNIAVTAGGLEFLGSVKSRQGDYSAARALYEESLALLRSIDDKSGIAWVIGYLGIDAHVQGDYATSRALFEESLALFRAIGAKWAMAYALGALGELRCEQGDYTEASALLEESLALFRASGDKRKIAEMHLLLATVALAQGETAAARARGEESLALLRAIDFTQGIAYGTLFLGLLARAEGHVDQAEALFVEALAQSHALEDNTFDVAVGLAGLAVLAADRAVGAQAVGSARRAARLAGAAALLEALQAQLTRQFREPYAGAIATARAMLGDEAFDAAWQAGKQLTRDEAVAFALAPEASAA